MADTKPVDLDTLGIETLRSLYFGDTRIRDRNHADVKWRAAGDPEMPDVWVLTGYPAVTGEATVLYESKNYLMRETIAPGAFDDVLDDDCHLNYSHESPSAMCRNGLTGPGGMELSVDAHGLRVHALIPKDDIDAQRLAPKMMRGVVDQMSFAFSVGSEECLCTEDEDGREVYDYTITKVRRLYDVTVCPLGAYSQTEAMLRSVLANGRSLEGRTDTPVRSEEGQDSESRADAGVQSVESDAHKRAVIEADAALAALQFRPRTA